MGNNSQIRQQPLSELVTQIRLLEVPDTTQQPTLVRVLTPSVSPNQKTFKVVLVCCSRDPSPHPPSIFGGFGGFFASVCSHPSGVPVTSPLFLAASEHVLHLFVFITSSALPITHCCAVWLFGSSWQSSLEVFKVAGCFVAIQLPFYQPFRCVLVVTRQQWIMVSNMLWQRLHCTLFLILVVV